MKRFKIEKKIVMTLITSVCIVLIFMNSLQSGDISSEQSGNVILFLQNFFNGLGIKITVSSHFIRKLAHFTEFAVLGVLMGSSLRTYTKRIIRNIFAPLFFGLLVAVTDEFIQLFSNGRAGMIQDVVLDFSGFITGLCIIVTIILFRDNMHTK